MCTHCCGKVPPEAAACIDRAGIYTCAGPAGVAKVSHKSEYEEHFLNDNLR